MTGRIVFERFARRVSNAIGTSHAFFVALSIIVTWSLLGPVFGFSDTWQLVVNTGTTIITFLVVFLIQSTQNRDAKAIHLKLDELLHVVSNARAEFIDAEDRTEQELDELDEEFKALRRRTRTHPLQNVLRDHE